MPKIRAELGQTFLAVMFFALSPGCSSGSGSDGAGDVDGGGDAPSDGTLEEGVDGSCDAATKPACCCAGDVEAFPVCSAAGSYVCPAGYNAYSAEQCSEPCGPCRLPCHDTGIAETTTSEVGDADTGDTATCETTNSCCCDGDVVEAVTCTPDGAPTCSASFTLFHGDDCTRPCGPCTFAPSCFDTGVDGG